MPLSVLYTFVVNSTWNSCYDSLYALNRNPSSMSFGRAGLVSLFLSLSLSLSVCVCVCVCVCMCVCACACVHNERHVCALEGVCGVCVCGHIERGVCVLEGMHGVCVRTRV